MQVSESVQRALKAALAARENAHAPYSKFKVGSAVQVKGRPEPLVGCNVENASYGATICAERVALTQAVALHGKSSVEFILVVTDEDSATVPCANCLQVIAELAGDDTPVYLANLKGVQKKYSLKELLPHPFRSFEVK
ncbi:MAG: cytidine deaminase [Bdellovibrionales bacterium]